MKTALSIMLALSAAGCADERPPAPTTEESDQLNEVEELLNQQAQEEGPENRSPGPSSNSTN